MKLKPILALCLCYLISVPLLADTTREITSLLNSFLAGVNDKEVHNNFWAEDLVYTSSSGKRFGKSTIMKRFDSSPEKQDSDEAQPRYSAEDIHITPYDHMAVLTFKLMMYSGDKNEAEKTYYNTGTLIKRDNRWQVVAWQATIIPEEPNQ